MNIPIYKQEINDGLEALLSNNSIACHAVAQVGSPSEESVEKLRKIVASQTLAGELALAENKNQLDLYYIKSILVSTGWNKNDDVFDPKELWDAKSTPEDKPFNFMHDENDIIGHITANEVVDFDGKRLDPEAEDYPSQFNILTSAVIYTEWSDPDRRERMQKIIAEIEQGKWFVSMECLFPNFDYALRTSQGETRIVPRNEASAFLTKHLRSYGGDGKYEDYQVGRLLRNLSFSGKGLVSKPANPRSIILEGNDFFDESQAKVLCLSSIKENDMSELDKQVEDLRAELAEAKAANEALKEKVVAEQQAEFETKIQTLEATIAEQATKLEEQVSAAEAISESLKQAEEALAKKHEEMEEKTKELEAMKKKEAMYKRKASLVEAGMDAEEAVAAAEEFEALDDETFAKVVALYSKKEAGKKEKASKPVEAEAQEADADEVDSAEASEEVLEEVEAPSEVAIAEAMGEEDPAENLRAVATEWIGSILKSSK